MDSSTLFTLAWKASSCAVSLSVVSWRREWDGDDETLAHKAGGGLLHPTERGQYWVLQSVALPDSAGSSYFNHCPKHTAPPLHALGDDVRVFKAGGSLAFKIHANRPRCPCPFSSLTAPSTRLLLQPTSHHSSSCQVHSCLHTAPLPRVSSTRTLPIAFRVVHPLTMAHRLPPFGPCLPLWPQLSPTYTLYPVILDLFQFHRYSIFFPFPPWL